MHVRIAECVFCISINPYHKDEHIVFYSICVDFYNIETGLFSEKIVKTNKKGGRIICVILLESFLLDFIRDLYLSAICHLSDYVMFKIKLLCKHFVNNYFLNYFFMSPKGS